MQLASISGTLLPVPVTAVFVLDACDTTITHGRLNILTTLSMPF
jgi:hypothetical protein